MTDFIQLIDNACKGIQDQSIDPETTAELWGVFAPTCDWDDMGGDVELGNRIFGLIETLYGRPYRKLDK